MARPKTTKTVNSDNSGLVTQKTLLKEKFGVEVLRDIEIPSSGEVELVAGNFLAIRNIEYKDSSFEVVDVAEMDDDGNLTGRTVGLSAATGLKRELEEKGVQEGDYVEILYCGLIKIGGGKTFHKYIVAVVDSDEAAM